MNYARDFFSTLLEKFIRNYPGAVVIVSHDRYLLDEVAEGIVELAGTNVFAIPKRVLYSCLPISGALMLLYSIRDLTVAIIDLMKPPQQEG